MTWLIAEITVASLLPYWIPKCIQHFSAYWTFKLITYTVQKHSHCKPLITQRANCIPMSNVSNDIQIERRELFTQNTQDRQEIGIYTNIPLHVKKWKFIKNYIILPYGQFDTAYNNFFQFLSSSHPILRKEALVTL